jgi:hypothetical protein
MLGDCPPLPIVWAAHLFRHLFARLRIQTHPRFRLLVRPRAAGQPRRLPGAGLEVSETALQTTAGTLRSKFTAALCSIAPSVQSLLASFPAIIGDGKGKPSPKHKIRHTIETTGRPMFAKACRLDPDKLRQAEAEFR